MKWIFLLLMFSPIIFARQMYKIKCYTPSGVEDRTKLAKYIHLDMIQDDFVVAIVNEAEFKDVKKYLNLEIEVLSSFDTDKNELSQSSFNQMLLMQESPQNVLAFHQSYMLSIHTKLNINMAELIKEKLPTESKTFDLVVSNAPQYASFWSYNKSTQILTLVPQKNAKGQVDVVELTTSALFPQVLKFNLEIQYH